MNALGLIEVPSVTASVGCLDAMCKTADVRFVTWERKLGGRLVTIIVEGDVSAVTAAVERAKQAALIPVCASAVIARPHEATVKMVELSRGRMKRQLEAKKRQAQQKKAVKADGR